jgi:hypothetical protein
MSHNLTQLRENHCRPANLIEKADKGLFALEKNTKQGRTLISRATWKRLPFLEFDPSGLNQTYRDEKTGAELPVFAVFNLEGSHRFHVDIGLERKPAFDASLNLVNHLPFSRVQKFLESLNRRNLQAHRVASFCYLVLAALAAAFVALMAGPRLLDDPAFSMSQGPGAIFQVLVLCGAAFLATLASGFLITAVIVNHWFPAKALALTATFDGLLPKETREKARRARAVFDNLYLVVDQQRRWKSELLPIPAAALLDPLLIGEKREQFGSRYYLIDQFELTKAEEYLVAEFLATTD